MLVRLKVDGFKSLVDTVVHFGPFTCIAGPNAAGKSNLFDAIVFLRDLADKPILEAALGVRDGNGGSLRGARVDDLFHRTGTVRLNRMTFEADMIVPPSGVDDFGQEANASITFLRYRLTLGRRLPESPDFGAGPIELIEESLDHLKVSEARSNLPFPHAAAWRRSVVKGRRTSPFLSSAGDGEGRIVRRHQDGVAGRPSEYLSSRLPRTVLSSCKALESPTAFLARSEMRSWRLLQLEPSHMRAEDAFQGPFRMDAHGAHLPATLARLAGWRPAAGVSRSAGAGEANLSQGLATSDQAASVFAQVANRVSELVESVRDVRVDVDPRRELLSLVLTDLSDTRYAARDLSDGTLRFIALAVLEVDPEAAGVVCLEEPENGIHPERIPAMIKLLVDLATEPSEPAGADDPLRQVIVNSHSPAVVANVSDDSLIVALSEPVDSGAGRLRRSVFRWLSGTWRARSKPAEPILRRGQILAYLDPLGRRADGRDDDANIETTRRSRRVRDNPTCPQIRLPFLD